MTEPTAPAEPIDEDTAEAYYCLFTSPTGAIVLDDLVEKHSHRSSIVDPHGNFYPPHAVQALEGERRVILRIRELMAVGSELSRRERIRKEEINPLEGDS